MEYLSYGYKMTSLVSWKITKEKDDILGIRDLKYDGDLKDLRFSISDDDNGEVLKKFKVKW